MPVDDLGGRRSIPRSAAGTLDALKRLLLRESQVQPLLLVFEDLHWIDSETQALLDGLVESLAACRCSCSSTTGPSISIAWGSKTYYTQLRLDPLPPESAGRAARRAARGRRQPRAAQAHS